MRSRSGLVLIAAAALSAGSATHAGPLIAATWTQSIQGVDLTVTNASATCTSTGANIVQQTITCPGAGLGATGSSTASTYSASLTMPFFSLSQFTTGGTFNVNTVVTLSGSQKISGGNSSAGATTGVPGKVTRRLATHVTKGANASLLIPGFKGLPGTLVQVPLSVGKAGTLTGYLEVLSSTHYITVDFYAWTPHTLTFTGLTSKFAPLPTPTVVAMGSFGLTAMGGGTLTLVSPSKISIDGALSQRRTIASLSTLKLTYAAPEPGLLLLLGAGAAGLVHGGKRRHARR